MLDFSKYTTTKKPDYSKDRQKELMFNFPKFRTVSLPEHLGGGEYKTAGAGTLQITPRAYGGYSTREGFERDHIRTVALGGTSSARNIQYLESPFGTDFGDPGRQEGKVSVETEAIGKYKAGKISLPQARLDIATKQQQIKGLTPTEEEQELSPFFKGLEAFSNIADQTSDFLFSGVGIDKVEETIGKAKDFHERMKEETIQTPEEYLKHQEDIADLNETIKNVVKAVGEGIFGEEHKETRQWGRQKGVLEGAAALESTLAQGASILGWQGMEDNLRAMAQEDLEGVRNINRMQEVMGTRIENKEKFINSIQDPAWTAEAVNRNLPNLLFSMGVALPAAAVSAPAVVTGGLLFGSAAALEGGFAYNEAKQFGATDDEAVNVATITGIANGMIESFPLFRLLRRSPLKKEVLSGVIGKFIKIINRTVTQAGIEAGTESLQEIVANSAARIYDENRDRFSNVKEAAYIAFLLGGGSSVVTDVIQSTKGRIPGLTIEEVKRPEEEITQEPKLDPLTQEIQKAKAEGKSFDEFVKLQPTLYHGTTSGTKISEFDITKKDTGVGRNILNQGNVVYFTKDPQTAKVFSKLANENKALKTLDIEDLGKVVDQPVGEVIKSTLVDANIKKLNYAPNIDEITKLKEQDFDGVEFPDTKAFTETLEGRGDLLDMLGDETTIAVWNIDKIKTKPQLKEIWEQEVKPAPKPVRLPREEIETLVDFTDVVNKAKTLPAQDKKALFQEADRIATSVGLDTTKTNQALAKEVSEFLDQYGERKVTTPKVKEPTKEKTPTEKAQEKIMTEKEKVKRRRDFIGAVKKQFGLSDNDLRKISQKDIRLMDNYEFKKFLDDIRIKAVELQKTKQKKNELISLMAEKEFIKVENLRKSMKLPPISKMTTSQLDKYIETLEQFQTGDTFLTERQLEVVDRSDLIGIKTTREAREMLAKKINVPLESLDNIKVSALDQIKYDSALANKNPFFGFIVKKTQEKILIGEQSYLEKERNINDLARKADKSREKGILNKIKSAVVPRNTEIIDYLEAKPKDKQGFAENLTKEELDYANYIEQYYSEAYDHLVQIKELYGSRFVDQYFTHTRKTFLENWQDNGIINAFREVWKSNQEDQLTFNILDQDTGDILNKSKFFQYTIHRSGNGVPSQNLTRVFKNYVKTFERKRMLDSLIPEVDIYTEALTPQQLTPKGLEMDRSLKKFFNKYLNNKKGRKESYGGLIKQNGHVDLSLRAGNMFVSLFDLGLNIGASTAATVGEQIMTVQTLGTAKYLKAWKRRVWDIGIKRHKTKQGQSILKKYEGFIGRNFWTEIAEPGKQVNTRVIEGLFSMFHQSTVEANKLTLLGSMSKEEFKSGELSSERIADIKVEAGRWRDMGKSVRSIVGATSLGATMSKYKTWAIPILGTTVQNLNGITTKLKQGNFKKALTSKEMKETIREIMLTGAVIMIGSYVMGEEDDESFLGKLKARIYMEAQTIMGGLSIPMFLSVPRLYSFIQNLVDNLDTLIKLEEYEQTTKWGEEGQLKGWQGLERQFTPRVIGQFETTERDKTTPDFRTTTDDMFELDIEDGVDLFEIKKEEEVDLFEIP